MLLLLFSPTRSAYLVVVVEFDQELKLKDKQKANSKQHDTTDDNTK